MGPSRHILSALALSFSLAFPRAALGAEITRVATAFEAKNPFDVNLDVGFSRTWRQGNIVRESHPPSGGIADVLELHYSEMTNQLPMRAAVGLYHDLELHVSTALVFSDQKSWSYTGGTTEASSTIFNNVLDKRCTPGPTCTPLASAQPIFAVPGSSYRAGLGDVVVGFSWAPLSDQKDDTKPKWVVSLDYQIPTAMVDNPAQSTTPSATGGIGDKVHRFNLSTALSKRLGAVDPYIKFSYSLPVQASGSWNNCNAGGAQLAYPENCGVGPWTPKETGIKPQHLAGVLFGAEFYLYDAPEKHQRVGIDIQLGGTWVGEGRIPNELSDALGKLLYTEDHFTLGGQVGVYARAAEAVQLRLNASLYHDTEHFLTNEPIGRDLGGKCPAGGPACIDTGNGSKELSPNFDFRYDLPGRRFRISQVTVFQAMATGAISF